MCLPRPQLWRSCPMLWLPSVWCCWAFWDLVCRCGSSLIACCWCICLLYIYCILWCLQAIWPNASFWFHLCGCRVCLWLLYVHCELDDLVFLYICRWFYLDCSLPFLTQLIPLFTISSCRDMVWVVGTSWLSTSWMVSMRVLAVFSSLSLDQILFAGQCVSSSKLAFWMFCDGMY